MFKVDGTTITMSRGDTGSLKITANAIRKDTQQPYTFGTNDRALFTLKASNGQVVKQSAYQMTNNIFTVVFANADTDTLTQGGYTWDVRYVINPRYDAAGHIVDGDQVITPNTPMNVQMLNVVGEI